MRLFITMILLSLLATMAVAQSFDSKNAEYVIPASRVSHCQQYEVKSYYQSTDLSISLEEQQKLLNAARAYHELDLLGQEC